MVATTNPHVSCEKDKIKSKRADEFSDLKTNFPFFVLFFCFFFLAEHDTGKETMPTDSESMSSVSNSIHAISRIAAQEEEEEEEQEEEEEEEEEAFAEKQPSSTLYVGICPCI